MTNSWDAQLQKVLNAHHVSEHFTNAREPIPITVHILWEHDGEEWIEGRAVAWTRTLVLVYFDSRGRLPTNGVWVDAGDVKRR